MAKKEAGIVRVDSDDLDSQPEGWVEMCAYLKTKHLPYVMSLDEDTIRDDAAFGPQKAEAMQRTYELLAQFITDWNWKDPEGTAYPKPAGNWVVFGELRPEEYRWLNVRLRLCLTEGTEVPKANGEPS